MTKEERLQIINEAKEFGMKSVTIEGITYEFHEIGPRIELSDEDLKKLENLYTEGEYTEEEMLYYATPYFDELMEKKNRKLQLEKEQKNVTE